MPSYAYDARVRLDEGGDPRAIGGAVTVALCGAWQHDGLCEYPHQTSFEVDGSNRIAVSHLKVHVDFIASDAQEATVRALVEGAVTGGHADGADDATTWSVL